MRVNKQELKTLFNLYYKKVFYAAFYVTKDKHVSEDITQDTFLKAYKKLHQLRDTEKLESWLVRIAINLAYDELKRRKRNFAVPDLEFEKDDSGAGNPQEIYLKRETNEILTELIYQLDTENIHILYLKYYEGLTTKKISSILEIPEGTVKSRLKKIKSILNRKLTSVKLIPSKVNSNDKREVK